MELLVAEINETGLLVDKKGTKKLWATDKAKIEHLEAWKVKVEVL